MMLFNNTLVLLFFALPIFGSAFRYDGPVKKNSVGNFKCRDLQQSWCKKMSKKTPKRFGENCGIIGSEPGFCCETCKDLHEQGKIKGKKPQVGRNLVENKLGRKIETCRTDNIFTNRGAFSKLPENPKHSPDDDDPPSISSTKKNTINLKLRDTRAKWKNIKPKKDGVVTWRSEKVCIRRLI